MLQLGEVVRFTAKIRGDLQRDLAIGQGALLREEDTAERAAAKLRQQSEAKEVRADLWQCGQPARQPVGCVGIGAMQVTKDAGMGDAARVGPQPFVDVAALGHRVGSKGPIGRSCSMHLDIVFWQWSWPAIGSYAVALSYS